MPLLIEDFKIGSQIQGRTKMKFLLLFSLVAAQYNRNLNLLGSLLSKSDQLNLGESSYQKPKYDFHYDDENQLTDGLSWSQHNLLSTILHY